jgi:NAD(P)-dependent dehydrogenase (short-subunit alcohol dehydrogenase family)
LGEALVLALTAEGTRVVVADIEGERAEGVAARVRERGGHAIWVPTDVSKRDSVESLAEQAYAEFGEVNLLFNNAGVISFGPLTSLTEGDWRWMSSVNMDGVVHGLLAFLPRMLEAAGERHIVNTGSIAGLIAVPGQSGYSATKHAIVSLSESLHVELEPHGIGVSVICPGAVATNIVDAVRNRPEALGGRAEGPDEMRARIAAQGTAPDIVARKVLAGIRANELYIVTHPANRAAVVARHERLMAAYDRQAGDA